MKLELFNLPISNFPKLIEVRTTHLLNRKEIEGLKELIKTQILYSLGKKEIEEIELNVEVKDISTFNVKFLIHKTSTHTKEKFIWRRCQNQA